MSEDTTETTAPPEDESEQPAWYRDQMAKKDAEIKELTKKGNKQHVKLMFDTFDKVGLDPTTGLGKAISEKYDGEPDADELRNYAIENYQWEPPEPENPLAEVITDAQVRVSGAVADTESVPQQQIDIDIEKAESEGDFASSVALKVQKYRTAIGK